MLGDLFKIYGNFRCFPPILNTLKMVLNMCRFPIKNPWFFWGVFYQWLKGIYRNIPPKYDRKNGTNVPPSIGSWNSH